MIILDCDQNSDEWFAARLGIPTASCFDKICTPTGKSSTQSAAYMNKLLADWLLGSPSATFTNDAVARGTDLEGEARSYYEFYTGLSVQQVGFCYRDTAHLVGASPDGLVGDDGGIEIKCPLPHTHVGYLLSDTIPTAYNAQVQGPL